MKPREAFNKRVEELGLKVLRLGRDGWACAFQRADGLYLWRIAGYRGRGLGIQTAWEVNKRYAEHQPFHAQDFITALNLAVLREGR